MSDVRRELLKIRERLVLQKAMGQQLADLALDAPPELARQIESILGLAFTCVCKNIDDITALLDSLPLESVAA